MKRYEKSKIKRGINGAVTVEITRPGWKHSSTATFPARITQDRIYTMTRAFQRDTLAQLSGIAGESQHRIISYQLEDTHANH